MKVVLLQETEVNTGSGTWERIDWTAYDYDAFGRLTDTFRSDGTKITAQWGSCCGKDGETFADGTEMAYTYDELRRLDISTRIGYGTQPNLITDYKTDAAGRTVKTIRMGGSLSLTSETEYDVAGRSRMSTSRDGTVSTTDYSPDGLTTTTTMPGGATRVTTRYLDGRTKSVTGTGVTPTFYEFGVNTDGTRWTKVYTGTGDNTAANWQKTTTDFLGRTVKTEKPAYTGATATATTQYDVTVGRPLLATTPGRADTFYEYNTLGEMTRSGLDVNDDGDLDLASTDRISESTAVYEKSAEGTWWRKSTSTAYPTDNSATPLVTGTSWQRLTGLGNAAPSPYSGILTAESKSEDLHGNVTVSRTYTDRANKTVWRVTDVPTSTIDAVTKTVNGQLVASSSPTIVDANGDAVEITYGYDGLGRRTTVVDPRAGTSTTHYNSLGQVDYVEDAGSNRTEYAYDNAPTGTSEENLINYTGRRISTTNALNKTQHTAYTLRGQIAATWGDTAYPLAYDYDVFGRMTNLYTLRDETITINSYADIVTNISSFDKTTWIYQESTGLLTRKEYADGKGTDYTYDDAGRLNTRTWARQYGSSLLVTQYSYDPATGELTTVDYSDTTPDISYTYYRTGQKKTVTAVTYGYLANAAMVTTTTFPNGLVTTRAYESHSDGLESDNVARNLVDYVENKVGTTTISKYNYTNEPRPGISNGTMSLARRTDMVMAGTAFTASTLQPYCGSLEVTASHGYNDRSEVTAGEKYNGTDINDKTNPVAAYDYGYDYDPIGNRDTYDVAGNTTSYTANQLNQYVSWSSGGGTPLLPQYDDDGNMTFLPSSSGDWTITWNGENRMTVADHSGRNRAGPTGSGAKRQSATAKLEFTYDYMGRRVQKKVYSGSAIIGWTLEKDTKYVYDGWNLILETTTTYDPQSTTHKTFVWGLDLSQTTQGAGGVGGLLAVTEQGATPATYYATYDANGNVSEYLDSNGATVAHYEYSPFGRSTAATGTKAADFAHRFSTKYLDEHGLYYYGYFFYILVLCSMQLQCWHVTEVHIQFVPNFGKIRTEIATQHMLFIAWTGQFPAGSRLVANLSLQGSVPDESTKS